MELDFSNKNVDFKKKMISISDVINMLKKPFDQEGVATNTYNKHFNNPESEYYQKSVAEICEMWSNKGATSRHYGQLLDDYIGCTLTGTEEDMELYKLDNDIEGDKRLSSIIESFEKFYALVNRSGDMEFVTREKTVYLPMGDYYVKGRFDALFRNKRTGKYVIIDWKSNDEIKKDRKPWTENLLGPANIYPELDWYTYTLQLYFYKTALVESGYLPEGTKIEDVEVMLVQLPGHICPSGQMYEIYRPAFMYDRELLGRIFDFAFKKKQLLAKKEEKNIETKNE